MVSDRKIAFIDLSEQSAKVESIPAELRRKFLGGRGLNMWLLSRHYSRQLDPFSPENPLIFGAGLLSGTFGFGSRLNITSKSPESGHLGDTNMGGEFAAELVKAGFSHLVITGKSEKPVYLSVKNGALEIRSALHLRGIDTVETQKMIRSELGDQKTQVACIGLGGENLVRFSAVRTGMKNTAGRTGMGAVMGSKGLKAVAVRGTMDIMVPDPQRYLAYYHKTLKQLMETKWAQALGKHGTPLLFHLCNTMGFLSVRNNQFTTVGERGSALETEALERYSTGMLSCFACPVHCRQRYAITEGKYKGTRGEGPEYGSIGSLGPKLGSVDPEDIIFACELSNHYGLDTMSMGSYIAWAMELYQRGIIGADLTGIPLDWGNGASIIELIHRIAQRKGFGDILAEGRHACNVFGESSLDYLLEIKNFPIEMTDERLPKSFALGMATASRGACHMRSRASIDALGLPEHVLENVYGGPVSNQFASYAGKGRMVWWHEVMNAVCDSLGFCRFLSVFSSPRALAYEQFSEFIALATGLSITPEELKTVGERVCSLERSMLAKDGISRRDDTLPRRYFEEPVPDGPCKGQIIVRKEFDRMLDEYYRLHGWDNNGIPDSATLERLEISS
ncbi:MAG TPA: aldehyde ferredoxin oxidoreductase family protein [Syntrophorhabdales bacterium]|nr:aldehyde ferredoxin oxidoreductase family protein [Syntrophorhabdales bacterium]